MSQENSPFPGIPKKYAVAMATGAACCVFAVAWSLCTLEFNAQKRDILLAQEEAMDSWVTGTTNAVSIWKNSLQEQARRISGSELYRLFASELSRMDERDAALINEADTGLPLPEGAASLAEEVPIIRNVLLDFMNYNGMQDARLVSADGRTILSALARPTPVTPSQKDAVARAVAENRTVFAPVRASSAGLAVDMADPVLSTMETEGDKPVAALMVTIPVTGSIAQFLARDPRQGKFFPHLLQLTGSGWEELQVSSAAPAPLDAAALSLQPQDGRLPFAPRAGLNGQPVYSLGARVPGMDWWVTLESPAADVAAQLHSEAWLIYGLGALGGLGFALLLALAWRMMVGRQQRLIAERFQHLYKIIARQKSLLDSVNLSLNVGLFMADVKGQIQVANRAFAEIVQHPETELPGSNLTAFFSGKALALLMDNIRAVASQNEPKSFEMNLPQHDDERLYRVTLFPFRDEVDDDINTRGAVAILQDITEFRRGRERRRLQQEHAMNAFVRAIEGVDPYLSGHSRKMARLGEMVAQSMGLSEADRNTIVTAASLSQVGKLFVPRELLAKTGKLTPAEQAEMALVPEHAYRVLKDIDFDLPVPTAIHQMYEHMDGTGYPQKLKGDAISLHARILAVLNAFCAMVTPRSYRAAMSIEDALRTLRQNNSSFDPHVVEILEVVLHTPEGISVAAKIE